MDKQKMTEAEKEALAKKQEEERIVKEEKARTAIEKYKIKEIGGWMILPWLLFLIFFIYGLYDYFANENINWYLIIPIGAIGLLMGLASEVEDNWKKRVNCKEKIHDEDENYKWTEYEYEHIYTDSKWDYFLYKTAKIISYLVSFVLIAIIGILLFMWIGSISIAPTSIIIILLIIIIMNQNRER